MLNRDVTRSPVEVSEDLSHGLACLIDIKGPTLIDLIFSLCDEAFYGLVSSENEVYKPLAWREEQANELREWRRGFNSGLGLLDEVAEVINHPLRR